MPDVYPRYQKGEVTAIIDNLIEAVDHMEKHSYDEAANLYLRLVREENGANGLQFHPGIGLRPLQQIQEWKPNVYGCLQLPRLDTKTIRLTNAIAKNADAAVTANSIKAAIPASIADPNARIVATSESGGYVMHKNFPNGSLEYQNEGNNVVLSVNFSKFFERRFGLPPFYSSWPGLRTIAGAFSSFEHDKVGFERTYGLKYVFFIVSLGLLWLFQSRHGPSRLRGCQAGRRDRRCSEAHVCQQRLH
jgi:hypothetical protein